MKENPKPRKTPLHRTDTDAINRVVNRPTQNFPLRGQNVGWILSVLVLALLLLPGCANTADEQPPEGQATLGSTLDPDMLDMMNGMVEVFAETLWNAVLEEESLLQEDGNWRKFENAAIGLQQAGKLLMLSHPDRDDDNWMRLSQAMIDTAGSARQSARERDFDALLESGDMLVETCESCHNEYLPD